MLFLGQDFISQQWGAAERVCHILNPAPQRRKPHALPAIFSASSFRYVQRSIRRSSSASACRCLSTSSWSLPESAKAASICAEISTRCCSACSMASSMPSYSFCSLKVNFSFSRDGAAAGAFPLCSTAAVALRPPAPSVLPEPPLPVGTFLPAILHIHYSHQHAAGSIRPQTQSAYPPYGPGSTGHAIR